MAEDKTIDKNNSKSKSASWSWALFIIALLIFLFKKKTRHQDKVIHKGELLELYGVNKKTLNKWILFFCDSIWTIEEYNAKRKITLEEYVILTSLLGTPSENTPVLSKAQIAKLCDSDTKTLRDCILLDPSSYGLTEEIYNSMNKFPPSIAQQIIAVYQ